MGEAGLKGIRRRNLTAELGVRQGFLNTRLTTSHQPGKSWTPCLRNACLWEGRFASERCVVQGDAGEAG